MGGVNVVGAPVGGAKVVIAVSNGGFVVGEAGVGGAGASVEDLFPRISSWPSANTHTGLSQHGLFGSCSRWHSAGSCTYLSHLVGHEHLGCFHYTSESKWFYN